MSRVASLCAIIDSRSLFGGWSMRSFQSLRNRSRIRSVRPAARLRSATTPSGPGSVVATSDQRVSLRRSSQGKSNSTASICVVSSIETWSTQSNTSFLGRLSRHSAERLRMLIASWSRWVGVNIGATVLRCALWRGWSMAMKLSRRRSTGGVADGDAAERRRRREHRMVGLDVHDVVVFGHRPVRPEHAVLAVMDRVFLAQPVEIRPERIGAKQFGIAGIELLERDRIGPLARGLLLGILERDRSFRALASPRMVPIRGWSRRATVVPNYIPLRGDEGKGEFIASFSSLSGAAT